MAALAATTDTTGDNLGELFHRTLNEIYASYGQDPLDDRSFRYPE